MPAMRLCVVLALSALATACAGFGRAPCSPADWRAAGYADGAAGKPYSTTSEGWLACAEKGAAGPDMMEAFSSGRRDGLIAYCKPASGFAEGARGAAYAGVCEADAHRGFLEAYGKGRRLFDLQTLAIRTGQAMSDAQASLWDAKRRISEIETAITATTTSREERIELASELAVYIEESRRIEAALARFAEANTRAVNELAAYREALAADSEVEGGALRPTNAAF